MDANRRKSQNITIYDIAKELDVSVSTVSRVLNGFEYVKESTRRRVLETAERLGYVANVQARSLAGGRSNIIGVVVPRINNSYFSLVVSSIDDELTKAGLNLLLYTTHRHTGNEDHYVRTITTGMTDGLILVVPIASASYLNILQKHQFPYVIIDHHDPTDKSCVVSATNWQGAYDAVTHLLELGHQRIACVTGLMTLSSSRERLAGYKAALTDHGTAIHAEYIIEGDYWEPQGYEAGKKLLALPKRPTAIFAANDFTAFGVMRAVWEFGLSIPQDISIVGFDDVSQAPFTRPPLTTVHQPLEQMGRAATKLLLSLLENPSHPPEYIEFPTQLIIRESSSQPPHESGI
jgi:LacI family transcriptional regulator